MIRLLIADDQALVRGALAALLQMEDDLEVVAEVSRGDEVVDAATAAGATVREAPSNFVSGDRFASIRDPFGVRWSVMSRVEDISEEESARRVAEWAASMGGNA